MSRFTDHLGLELMEGPDGRPLLKDGRCQWTLDRPLTYDVGAEGSGVTITVPEGASTDLASIPRLVTNILPPDGPWTKAAVVHDFLYRSAGTGMFGGRCYLAGKRSYTRAEADGVLREAMTVLGVAAWKRFVIWAAVRVGGASGWGR